MSDLERREHFTISNGKVKELGCPYEDDSPVVGLTATEYMRHRHCLCSYCWKNRLDVVSVAAWEWVDNE